MEGISFFTFAPIIAAFLTGLFAIVFLKKDAEGHTDTDEGFSKNYFRLPYRKRMISNLISYPVIILILFIMYIFIDLSTLLSIIAGLILLISFLAEFIYNYKMWQKHERKGWKRDKYQIGSSMCIAI